MTVKSKSLSAQFSEVLDRLNRLERQLNGDRKLAEDRLGEKPPGYPDELSEMRVCSLPQVPPREFGPEISRDRARLIILSDKKWVNGTKLRYHFMENAPFAGGNDQKAIVREGFEVWKNIGIGIEFEEVRDISEAEIRIGFQRGDGAWSYVGRDVIDIPGQNERTMNFGWDLNTDPRREDVAVHEIGHTLGFPHEHQNPFAGIVWDEPAVYSYFGGAPNRWDRETTFYNILRKLPPGEVQGSVWDPDSIMHYGFPAGLITQPAQYHNGLTPAGGLSQLDIDQAHLFYPPLDPPNDPDLKVGKSEPLALTPAGQKNFVIKPTATRRYTIQTLGQSDTVMVLFEDVNGDLKFMAGDDDSGTDLNSRIAVRLIQGRRYVLRVRLYSNLASGVASVVMT